MKHYMTKRTLKRMVAKYIGYVNAAERAPLARLVEAYMCHVERDVSGRGAYVYSDAFSQLLDAHGVSRTGSLKYLGADGVRRTPNQNVRNKNSLRLTFLLLLLESGLH